VFFGIFEQAYSKRAVAASTVHDRKTTSAPHIIHHNLHNKFALLVDFLYTIPMKLPEQPALPLTDTS
jgi:hypothetical protein